MTITFDAHIKFHFDILPEIHRSEDALMDFLKSTGGPLISYKETASETGKLHIQGAMQANKELEKRLRNQFRYEFITKTKCQSPSQSYSMARFTSQEHFDNYCRYITKDGNLLHNELLTHEQVNKYAAEYIDSKNVPLKVAKKKKENVSEFWLDWITEKTSKTAIDGSRVPIESECTTNALITHGRNFVMGTKKLRNNSEHVVKNYIMLALHNVPYLNKGGWRRLDHLKLFDEKVHELLAFEPRL